MTETKIAKPGASVTQGTEDRRLRASLIMLPHSAVGGLAPRPRKLNPASSIIIVPISSMEVTKMGPTIFGRICLKMIFQYAGSSFCPIRTVGAQLYESMTEHESVSRPIFQTRAVELLQKIGFENGQRILDSFPFELSGGMQQRVGIAAAMLLNPGILLADEPTSALDVSVQKQVVEEMLLVRKTFGTAIVLVTHNIGVISAMADRVLVMRNGEMVEQGETRQVLEDPKEEYTRTLMSSVPRLRR